MIMMFFRGVIRACIIYETLRTSSIPSSTTLVLSTFDFDWAVLQTSNRALQVAIVALR